MCFVCAYCMCVGLNKNIHYCIKHPQRAKIDVPFVHVGN